MQPDRAMQCMRDIGISRESADIVVSLLQSSRDEEARQRLRRVRCDLMDELHACQRKVDQLDWLIRETEKQKTEARPDKGRMKG